MTRVAIVQTGAPPPALARVHGDYPAMFRSVLGDGFDTRAFDVQANEWPDAAAFDGAVITGSSAGVYEEAAWIDQLLDWIRTARGRSRLVGVCFGHQAMAQALGGRVEKSDRGWGVGLQRYAVVSHEAWMTPPADSVAVPASHQDQVVVPPPDARVILSSAFTPYGGLAWDDDAVSMQFHPEFTPAYAADLVRGRRGSRVPEPVADAALASLREPDDRALVGGWVRSFLKSSAT